MCGLFGIAGDTDSRLKDAFKDGLLLTQLRGRDATGAFAVKHNDETAYAKALGTPEILFDMKSYDTALSGFPKVMAGHCRSKTQGDNTRANAHPYDFDGIIGMHNGTLRNYYKLDGYDHKATDSHCLYYNIDRYGLEETFQEIDPTGAWALVWWNKTDNTLNFLRNGDRPLWFAWTADKRAMVWASEPWMFGVVNRRVSLWDGTKEDGEKQHPYFQLPENELWSFSVNDRAPKTDRTLTLHPIKKIEATGKSAVNFTKPAAGVGFRSNGYRGGEVARPFPPSREPNGNGGPELNDPLEDLIERFRNRHEGTGKTPAGSTTIHGTVNPSGKTSSTVLDFRRGKTRGTNSSKPMLSLPSPKSKDSPQDNNGTPRKWHGSCSARSDDLPKKVDVRTVAGTEYITDMKSGSEFSLEAFAMATKGTCCHCDQPIGGLEEVAEIFGGGASFMCTSCQKPPKLVLVG